MSIPGGGEMASSPDLVTGLQAELGRSGSRFEIKVVRDDWLAANNFKIILSDIDRTSLYDDSHHKQEWQTGGNATGCGVNDHLSEITAKFLALTERLADDDAIELARQLIGSQTGGDRTRQLVTAGAKVVAAYAGEHTSRRLVVNPIAGMTLDHQNPAGDRSFVVDAGSAQDPVKMALLAAAAVAVLLPPDHQIELVILRK